jgi:signal recognition particle GTPase
MDKSPVQNSAIDSFVQITDTYRAVAISFLQQHQYDLEAALLAFWDSNDPEAVVFRVRQITTDDQARPAAADYDPASTAGPSGGVKLRT